MHRQGPATVPARGLMLLGAAGLLAACGPHMHRDPRPHTGPGPGMRSLCQDAALLWPCPESAETASGEQAVRDALHR